MSRRRGVLSEFFSRWPGDDRHRLGFGRAVFEFQEWGIRTGRISAAGGSPWWSTVNGLLIVDVEDALDGARGPWADYVEVVEAGGADAQARLWSAHQESIRAGATVSATLLADEVPPERDFASIALGVVDLAASSQQCTSSGELGRATRNLYPRSYPCSVDDVAGLRGALDPRSLPTPIAGRDMTPGTPRDP